MHFQGYCGLHHFLLLSLLLCFGLQSLVELNCLFHWDSLFFILSLSGDTNSAKSIFAIHVTLPSPEFTVPGELTSNFALPLWLTVEKNRTLGNIVTPRSGKTNKEYIKIMI